MPARLSTLDPPTFRRQFTGFVLISGTGWLIDVVGLAILVACGVPVFLANMASAGLAVSFVFLVAQRRVFVHDGSLIRRRFLTYLGYNAVAILAASVAVAGLATSILEPVTRGLLAASRWSSQLPSPVMTASMTAKALVTPFTLYANFLFMRWLLERAGPARSPRPTPTDLSSR